MESLNNICITLMLQMCHVTPHVTHGGCHMMYTREDTLYKMSNDYSNLVSVHLNGRGIHATDTRPAARKVSEII